MLYVLQGRMTISAYLIQVVVLLLSLSIHEYSHARTAYRLGDDTAGLAGRLTLNPLAHLDPLGTLMILAGAPVGWAKPVPINPARFDRKHSIKKGVALVSVAGPLSNLALSVIGSVFYYLITFLSLTTLARSSGFPASILSTSQLMFQTMFFINIYLAVFNLLPVPPLDGSKIWGSLLPPKGYSWLMRNERYIGLGFIMLVVLSPSWFSRILSTVAYPVIWLIDSPIRLLFSAIFGIG